MFIHTYVCTQEGEEKNKESKLYTTEKTYEELLDLANDLRTGSPKHDDYVIAVWIKVGTYILVLLWHKAAFSYISVSCGFEPATLGKQV